MAFGNVELNNVKEGEDKNASEMVVARGFADVVRHRSDEERSSVYETLLELEEKAKQVAQTAHTKWPCSCVCVRQPGCFVCLFFQKRSCG
jgi:staphylococcal nuclease domain-containing protein 1